jgi:hypothetical protein
MVALGRATGQPGLVQAFDQHVAAQAVVFADLVDALLRPFKGVNGRDLDGRERAVVEVALEPRERVDEHRVADHEADAPAGHVVTLRQGEELDGDIFGAGNLEDAGRLVAVEGDVGVGQILDEVEAVFAWPVRRGARGRAGRRTRVVGFDGKLTMSALGRGVMRGMRSSSWARNWSRRGPAR